MVFPGIARACASAALVVLAACSNSGSSATTPSAGPIGPQAFKIVAGGSMSMEALQALRFYPSSLTIDAGDSVTWSFPSGEPHTVTLLGPRAALPPPNDPTAPVPAGGATYDGTAYTSSGFQLLGGSYTLTFPKPGTFLYTCLLHGTLTGGMNGVITVQPAGAPYPASNGTAVSAAAAAQAADLALAANAVSLFPFTAGGPHLVAGITPGLSAGPPAPSTVLRFLDGPSLSSTSVTVHVGDTVTWTNESNNEPHTVTLAPVGAPFPTLDPFSPPSGGNVYDGTKLVNSGVINPGSSFSVQFTKAGTYTYHCIFHDDTENMIGTVIVQ